jgi:hypothetical protein
MTRNNILRSAPANAEPIDFVTNENDSKAMGGMLRRCKTILGHNNFTGIYDKGYHTGSEFHKANQLELMF